MDKKSILKLILACIICIGSVVLLVLLFQNMF
jgi:hypothetical protein